MKKIDPEVLRNLCESVVINPLFQPRFLERYGLITQCNRAVRLIAGTFRCPLLGSANDICKHIRESKNWRKVDMYDAWSYAEEGALVVALEEGRIHGHVVVISPGKKVWSGKWVADCPIGANVGGDNWYPLRGINWAFKKIPDIYVWDKNDLQNKVLL